MKLLLDQGKSWSGREKNCAYLNVGRGARFANVSSLSGVDFPDDGRAMCLLDWDQDGDLDAWIGNRTGPRLRFLRNTSDTLPGTHGFVALRLRGTTSNRDGIGARVEVLLPDAGDQRLVQTLFAGDAYLSQSSKWLHFGLGDARSIDAVTVRWPGGELERFEGVEPDGRYLLVQGTGRAEPVAVPERSLALEAGPEPEADALVGPVRLNPVPMPLLPYTDLDGQQRRTVPSAEGRPGPTLVVLWASWCAPCVAELKDLSANADRLRDSGLRILALSADGLDTVHDTGPAEARAMIERLGFPFETGLATPELLEKIDFVQRLVFVNPGGFGVPVSYLLDEDGSLAAIYRGGLHAAGLLEDLRALAGPGEAWRASTVPFEGRWLDPKGDIDPRAVAGQFAADSPADAEHLLGIAIARGRRTLQNAQTQDQKEQARRYLAEVLGNEADFVTRQGRGSEAIPLLEEAVRIWPAHPSAHMLLARLLDAEGRTEEAARHRELARQFASGSPEDRAALERAAPGATVEIPTSQLRRKFTQVAERFGLDPEKAEDLEAFRGIVEGVVRAPDRVAQGEFRRHGPVSFYVKDRDVVVVKDGTFVAILKDGVEDEDVAPALQR